MWCRPAAQATPPRDGSMRCGGAEFFARPGEFAVEVIENLRARQLDDTATTRLRGAKCCDRPGTTDGWPAWATPAR